MKRGKRKTEAEKQYEAWLNEQMDAIESPQELIAFILMEHEKKTKAMDEALGKLTAILKVGEA